jgi:hypothetical protein
MLKKVLYLNMIRLYYKVSTIKNILKLENFQNNKKVKVMTLTRLDFMTWGTSLPKG